MMARYKLTTKLEQRFNEILRDFDEKRVNFRLWAKDASLFSNTNEAEFLAWLNEPTLLLSTRSELDTIHAAIKKHNFSSVVLLGMGGSSLSPMVFLAMFAYDEPVYILDSIHPSTLARLTAQIDITSTLFIVASKSGTTLEPMLLYRIFLQRLISANVDDPYAHFMAITDPITALEQEASENGFLRGPFGKPGIGGRFSGLSVFGLLPALLMNIDIDQLLNRAMSMVRDTGPSIPARDNPAALLAAFFGAAAQELRDKIIFHLSPSLATLGLWLEQLLAESLGKSNMGLVPFSGEHNTIDLDSTMHVFVAINNEDAVFNEAQALPFDVPAYFITAHDRYDVAALMFLFQMATALFASIDKINPFNQPEVEDGKRAIKDVLTRLEHGEDVLAATRTDDQATVYDEVRAFIKAFRKGDYGAILAFVDETDAHRESLEKLQRHLEKKTAFPFMLQFGPRYLHSTGQLFKGGRNNGHFLVITTDYTDDIFSVANNLSLSQIHLGQALGDIKALEQKGRHTTHVRLSKHSTNFDELLAFIDSL